METKTVTIPNISCGHCKMRVEKSLKNIPAVTSAIVEVAAKTVTIQWDDAQATWSDLSATLQKIGYPPEQ